MKLLLHFLLTLGIFLLLDLVWLGFVGRPLYTKFIGHLMRQQVIWSAAILFYVLFNVGLYIFVIQPAMELNSLSHAAIYGALFGFINYMTYELTNMAVIDKWSWGIVPIDIAWGTIFISLVAVLSVYFSKFIYS